MRAAHAGRNTATDLQKDVDAIKDDIATLKADLVAAMRDLVDAGKAGAGDAKEKLEDAVKERLQRVSDAAHAVAERGRRAADTVHTYVEERPLQSVAIAFGVGILVGVVLRK
jgi:ElaB/YqjD/DUF883 family membrane-anchored ribosome-binding protein